MWECDGGACPETGPAVATEHGGSIEIESEVDRGTCVRIRFPIDTPRQDDAD